MSGSTPRVRERPLVPVLSIGPFTIATHDAFSVLALGVGLAIYYAALRRRGWLEPRIVWISLAAVLGGALGARLITAWEHLEVYAAFDDVPLTWAIEHSGKSLIGALAGGYLATVLAKRALGYTRSTGDAYLLAIPVAVVIGRIGCYLSELPLGTPTDLPWGVTVSADAAAAFARCPGCELPMHPSMLYEIAFNLIAIVVILRFRDRVSVPGDALKLYLLAAGIFRVWVETVRGNEPQALGLTGPQWVLIPLVALLVLHFVRQVRRGAYRVPAPPPTDRGHDGGASMTEPPTGVPPRRPLRLGRALPVPATDRLRVRSPGGRSASWMVDQASGLHTRCPATGRRSRPAARSRTSRPREHEPTTRIRAVDALQPIESTAKRAVVVAYAGRLGVLRRRVSPQRRRVAATSTSRSSRS